MSQNRDASSARRPDPDSGALTLVDLALFLWSQRLVILAAVGLSVLLAVAYALGRDRVYEFSTAVELGGYKASNSVRPFEPAGVVIAKLNSSYIPAAIEQWAAELENETGSAPGIRLMAEQLNETSLVLLSSPGKAEHSEAISELQGRILNMLMDDQRDDYEHERTRLEAELELASIELEELEDERVQRVERNRLENRISEARAAYERLADSERLIEEQLSSLESRKALIEARLPELSQYIEEARARRADVMEGAGSGVDGMTLMLISSALQEDIERQAKLEEILAVAIPNERVGLERNLADVRRERVTRAEEIEHLQVELEKLVLDQERAIARQRPRVRELRSSLDSLQMPRAIVEPRRSLQPVDVSSRNLIVIAAIAGGVLGVFLAGLISLLRAARLQVLQERGER